MNQVKFLATVLFVTLLVAKGQGDEGPVNLAATETVQLITSPGHPGFYGDNQLCLWIITAPAGCTVKLNFVAFSTELYGDYVTIRGVNGQNNPRYSGQDIPPMQTSTGTQIEVEFESDGVSVYTGFKAEYSASCPSTPPPPTTTPPPPTTTTPPPPTTTTPPPPTTTTPPPPTTTPPPPTTTATSGWSHWTHWSDCTVCCNGGTRARTRTCVNPPASTTCSGSNSETEACNTQACPVCNETAYIQHFPHETECEWFYQCDTNFTLTCHKCGLDNGNQLWFDEKRVLCNYPCAVSCTDGVGRP